MKRLPLGRLALGWRLALTLPLAAMETLLALYIQPGSLKDLCAYLLGQPLLLFLNFLPFWLLTLAAGSLFANPFFGAALTGAVGGVLSLVNRTMIEKRDEPLSPKDFALLREAGDAASSYGLSIDAGSLCALLAFVLFTVALGLLFRGKPLFPTRWGNLAARFVGALVFSGVLVSCVNGVYSSKELYNSFPVNNRYYIAGVYNQLGFPYCFCYNFNTYLVEKPEGFSKRETEAYIEETSASAGAPKNVNVVMVMNEAFCDVTNNENFDYAPGKEPLKHYNALLQNENVIAGHIVTPNYGAGTANTEFDVLTGMQTNMISASGASAFRVLNHKVDSVYRVFLEDGYQTQFIHPGQDWFYNRQNVYQYFGAQDLIFSERFENAERKGNWVTDAAVLQVMEEEFEAAMEKGKPYFNYTTTIQNHMSYTGDKYGDYPVEQVKLKKEVSPAAQTMLSVYALGARDADEMLNGLTEYFTSRKEPVLLVFFGDHLPQLGDGYLCYQELGISLGEGKDAETTLRTYETPYLIWVNDAAAQALDFQNAKEALALPQGNVISANYLGAMVLELTGRGEQDPFFAFVNQLRRELPVLHNGTGMTGDGETFTQPPQEFSEEIRKLRFWEYYRLKYE